MIEIGVLLLISSLTTLGAMIVLRRTSDPVLLRRTTNRIAAHVYELRLFLDEPRVIFRAQRELLRENLRLFGILARPIVILLVPFAFLFVELNAFFGHGPLVIGKPAIVTIQYSHPPALAELKAPDAAAVEIPALRQISWRIRPQTAVSGTIGLVFNGRTLTKTISVGPGFRYLSERRHGSLWAFLLAPTELPLNDAAIDWIEIRYPSANLPGFSWPVWFVLASAATALASLHWKL